jgi:hypothetical protein
MNLTPAKRSLCRIGALLTVSIALSTEIAIAAPMTPQQVLGDWEITALLVTDGFSNSKRSLRPNDPYVMGRKYSFQKDSVTYDNDTKRCKLDTSLARKVFPMKALFAEERKERPKLIRDRFYRRAAQYALGSLGGEVITIYAYRCEKTNNFKPQLNNTGNWFAATKDTIIWPLAPDALVLMKRQPTQPTTEQASNCNDVTQASDKTICDDREMWLMKKFTETVRECAIARSVKNSTELRERLDALVVKRNACDGGRSCVYETLSEHAYLLAQKIPSIAQCLELKTK